MERSHFVKMKRLVIIFAIIIQHSFGSQSQNTFKPSNENVSDICAMETIQDATISKFTDAINLIFTSIRAQKSRVTDEEKNVSNQETSSITLSKKYSYTAFEQGVDMFLGTIQRLAQNTSSGADTNAQRIIYDPLEMVFVHIYKAIDLSDCSDHSEIQSQFEELQNATVSHIISVCKGIYAEIRNGENSSDKIEKMLVSYEEIAINYAVYAVNRIYAGIRIVANICSRDKTGDGNDSYSLENTENETIFAIASWAKNVYASIRVFYSTLCVNKTDIQNIYAALDSAGGEADPAMIQGFEIVFGVMRTIASDAIAGRCYQSKYQSYISKIAEEEAYEAWMETIGYLLDSNILVQPVKLSVDVESRYVISDAMRNIVTKMFDGIKAAQRLSYSECMIELDRLQNQTISSVLNVTEGLYIAARNDRKSSDESLRIVNDGQNRTIPYVIDAAIATFDGIRFLAKVLSECEDNCDDDLTALDVAEARVWFGFAKEIETYIELLRFFAVSSYEAYRSRITFL